MWCNVLDPRKLTVDFLWNPKIGNFDTTLVIHENISTFDISVDYIAFMEVVESLENLSNKILHEWLLKGTVIPQ